MQQPFNSNHYHLVECHFDFIPKIKQISEQANSISSGGAAYRHLSRRQISFLEEASRYPTTVLVPRAHTTPSHYHGSGGGAQSTDVIELALATLLHKFWFHCRRSRYFTSSVGAASAISTSAEAATTTTINRSGGTSSNSNVNISAAMDGRSETNHDAPREHNTADDPSSSSLAAANYALLMTLFGELNVARHHLTSELQAKQHERQQRQEQEQQQAAAAQRQRQLADECGEHSDDHHQLLERDPQSEEEMNKATTDETADGTTRKHIDNARAVVQTDDDDDDDWQCVQLREYLHAIDEADTALMVSASATAQQQQQLNILPAAPQGDFASTPPPKNRLFSNVIQKALPLPAGSGSSGSSSRVASRQAGVRSAHHPSTTPAAASLSLFMTPPMLALTGGYYNTGSNHQHSHSPPNPSSPRSHSSTMNRDPNSTASGEVRSSASSYSYSHSYCEAVILQRVLARWGAEQQQQQQPLDGGPNNENNNKATITARDFLRLLDEEIITMLLALQGPLLIHAGGAGGAEAVEENSLTNDGQGGGATVAPPPDRRALTAIKVAFMRVLCLDFYLAFDAILPSRYLDDYCLMAADAGSGYVSIPRIVGASGGGGGAVESVIASMRNKAMKKKKKHQQQKEKGKKTNKQKKYASGGDGDGDEQANEEDESDQEEGTLALVAAAVAVPPSPEATEAAVRLIRRYDLLNFCIPDTTDEVDKERLSSEGGGGDKDNGDAEEEGMEGGEDSTVSSSAASSPKPASSPVTSPRHSSNKTQQQPQQSQAALPPSLAEQQQRQSDEACADRLVAAKMAQLFLRRGEWYVKTITAAATSANNPSRTVGVHTTAMNPFTTPNPLEQILAGALAAGHAHYPMGQETNNNKSAGRGRGAQSAKGSNKSKGPSAGVSPSSHPLYDPITARALRIFLRDVLIPCTTERLLLSSSSSIPARLGTAAASSSFNSSVSEKQPPAAAMDVIAQCQAYYNHLYNPQSQHSQQTASAGSKFFPVTLLVAFVPSSTATKGLRVPFNVLGGSGGGGGGARRRNDGRQKQMQAFGGGAGEVVGGGAVGNAVTQAQLLNLDACALLHFRPSPSSSSDTTINNNNTTCCTKQLLMDHRRAQFLATATAAVYAAVVRILRRARILQQQQPQQHRRASSIAAMGMGGLGYGFGGGSGLSPADDENALLYQHLLALPAPQPQSPRSHPSAAPPSYAFISPVQAAMAVSLQSRGRAQLHELLLASGGSGSVRGGGPLALEEESTSFLFLPFIASSSAASPPPPHQSQHYFGSSDRGDAATTSSIQHGYYYHHSGTAPRPEASEQSPHHYHYHPNTASERATAGFVDLLRSMIEDSVADHRGVTTATCLTRLVLPYALLKPMHHHLLRRLLSSSSLTLPPSPQHQAAPTTTISNTCGSTNGAVVGGDEPQLSLVPTHSATTAVDQHLVQCDRRLGREEDGVLEEEDEAEGVAPNINMGGDRQDQFTASHQRKTPSPSASGGGPRRTAAKLAATSRQCTAHSLQQLRHALQRHEPLPLHPTEAREIGADGTVGAGVVPPWLCGEDGGRQTAAAAVSGASVAASSSSLAAGLRKHLATIKISAAQTNPTTTAALETLEDIMAAAGIDHYDVARYAAAALDHHHTATLFCKKHNHHSHQNVHTSPTSSAQPLLSPAVSSPVSSPAPHYQDPRAAPLLAGGHVRPVAAVIRDAVRRTQTAIPAHISQRMAEKRNERIQHKQQLQQQKKHQQQSASLVDQQLEESPAKPGTRSAVMAATRAQRAIMVQNQQQQQQQQGQQQEGSGGSQPCTSTTTTLQLKAAASATPATLDAVRRRHEHLVLAGRRRLDTAHAATTGATDSLASIRANTLHSVGYGNQEGEEDAMTTTSRHGGASLQASAPSSVLSVYHRPDMSAVRIDRLATEAFNNNNNSSTPTEDEEEKKSALGGGVGAVLDSIIASSITNTNRNASSSSSSFQKASQRRLVDVRQHCQPPLSQQQQQQPSTVNGHLFTAHTSSSLAGSSQPPTEAERLARHEAHIEQRLHSKALERRLHIQQQHSCPLIVQQQPSASSAASTAAPTGLLAAGGTGGISAAVGTSTPAPVDITAPANRMSFYVAVHHRPELRRLTADERQAAEEQQLIQSQLRITIQDELRTYETAVNAARDARSHVVAVTVEEATTEAVERQCIERRKLERRRERLAERFAEHCARGDLALVINPTLTTTEVQPHSAQLHTDRANRNITSLAPTPMHAFANLMSRDRAAIYLTK